MDESRLLRWIRIAVRDQATTPDAGLREPRRGQVIYPALALPRNERRLALTRRVSLACSGVRRFAWV